MKRCFKCGETKELGEFYRHPQMADGHLNKCKDCARRDVDVRYRQIISTPEGLESERRRGREKYHRLYGKGPNWTSPPATEEQKRIARTALGNAIRDGKVIRPSACEDCGDNSRKVHGHHTNYEKPLDVVWVCPTCHRRRHALHPERVKSSPGRNAHIAA